MLPSAYGDPARLELGQICMRPRKKVSSAGIELIESFEGLRRKAARLPDGRWTIGYGHTQSAREGLTVTAEEARLLLIWDLRPVEAIVEALVVTPLNQNQFDALVAFAFNVGMDSFKDSDVLKLVNEARFTQAACALDLWRKADIDGDPLVLDALIRRRAAEKDLFLAPVEGEAPAPAPTALVRPAADPQAEAAVPETRPVELDAPMEGPVAAVHAIGEIEREPQPRSGFQPAYAAVVATRAAHAFAPAAEDRFEPSVEARPEPVAEGHAEPSVEADHAPVPEVHAETAPEPHAEPAEETRAEDAPLALTVAAAAAAAAAAAVAVRADAPSDVLPAEAPEAQAAAVVATADEAEAAETRTVAEAPAEVVVPLLTPPAPPIERDRTPGAEPDEDLGPSPSSWGVEPGQVSAMAVAVAWPVVAAPSAAPEPERQPDVEPVLEPEATAPEAAPIETPATAEPRAGPAIPEPAVLVEVAPESVLEPTPEPTPEPAPAPIAASAQPISMPDRGTPREPALESVFASYGPMAFAVMPRKPRPSEPASSGASAAEAAGETADPEPRPASPAQTAPVAPPAPDRRGPTVPARPAAASFGPMFVPETRNLSEIAPAPAVLAAAPEPQPLVLTSPPADWEDARYGGAPTITALSPEVDELETPLFDEGWDAPSALSSRVVRHEMAEEFTPPKRGLRFGLTGPWILLGMVGFVAFAGALFAFFVRSQAPGAPGPNEVKILAWALALLGAGCVAISVYFLMKRLGGTED